MHAYTRSRLLFGRTDISVRLKVSLSRAESHFSLYYNHDRYCYCFIITSLFWLLSPLFSFGVYPGEVTDGCHVHGEGDAPAYHRTHAAIRAQTLTRNRNDNAFKQRLLGHLKYR